MSKDSASLLVNEKLAGEVRKKHRAREMAGQQL
jgi:hypothetical protein